LSTTAQALLSKAFMMKRKRAGASAAACLSALLLVSACTGGSESNAAEEPSPSRDSASTTPAEQADARRALASINDSIPVYQGAELRSDMSSRDETMVRSRYGDGAQVYTLATNDSFPQVYHYYTTYLAQFRGFPSRDTYPSSRKDWRTLEVQLNQAMQDPFIPGEALDLRGKQVTLQVVETEAEPRTVIRYIVTPEGQAPPAVAAAPPPTAAPAPRTPESGVATPDMQVNAEATDAPSR
jgi:hypothetical protein